MTLHQQLIEWRIEGLEEGREEGRVEGEARLSKLIMKLLEDGRREDMELALKDKSERQKLYIEYSI